uniref:RNA-directed RNA polymerase L n=1 Tax=Eptesicus fuscus orthorubulavirus TaxID=2884705 RepID=A0A8K1K0M5_9MONO|nr:L [Eptesicus fuscus orthorubulavirus] [Eptesicus fuscus orthorubulavirus]
MADHTDVLLPEVHLGSPIVRHKLYYYILLGDLPNNIDPGDLGPLAHVNWRQIRREENRICLRLVAVRNELFKKVISLRSPITKNDINFLQWPRILPYLTAMDMQSYTCKIQNWVKIQSSAHLIINSKLDNFLNGISAKLTGRNDLFTSFRTRLEEQDTKGKYTSMEEINQAWNNNYWSDTCHLFLLIKYQMRLLIGQLKKSQTGSLRVLLEDRSGIIQITPELVCIYITAPNVISYLTFEMVLMVSDILEGRQNVIGLCTISYYLQPLCKRIQHLLTYVDNLALVMGDKVYSIVASLESLVYARLQMFDPVIDLRGQFHEFILDEMLTALANHFDLEQSVQICSHLVEIFSGLTPDLTAELLCIMRMWGHPTLTAAQAAGKVRDSMCAPKVLDFSTIMKTVAFFHTILINGYRRKHGGIWPPVTLGEGCPNLIISLKNDNAEISYETTLKYWKHISLFEFGKSFNADPGEDLSIFMKDKAISCKKSDWMSVFRRSLIHERCMQARIDCPTNINRRLLLNFLNDSNFDPELELEYVTNLDYLEDDDFCASYSLKEKEIKETGRIFAKLTKKMRSCQVIAESMLANHAGKLFRENGVVMDQLRLTKSLLTMSQIGIISAKSRKSTKDSTTVLPRCPGKSTQKTSPHLRSSSKPSSGKDPEKTPDNTFEIAACFLTTDLQKYCLNWRYQAIIPFARTLNRMYGYPHLFEWIHLRLMKSTLYVGDPFNPPLDPTVVNLDDAPNDDIFIVSPRGGIEGLCQKLWTMISIATIILSATESKTRVMSMVQGDNQTIAITTKVPRSIPHVQKKELAYNASKEFFKRLKANNFGIGHNLKEQETILSSDFFVYGKRIFWRGRILSQALKNASKLCLTADVLGDCTQSSCSNLATTIMRLTENGLEKDLAVKLNIFCTIRQLTYDLIFPMNNTAASNIPESYLNHPDLLIRVALLPSQLGGLNYLSSSRLFNRNIGDPLVSAFADLKRLIKSGCLEPWILTNIMKRPPGKGNWSTLAADPYAINIDYLYPPTIFLKRHAQQTLMESSVNPLLKGVFNVNAKQEENALAQFLLDRDIVLPRVAHVVLAQTGCGRRKQIQGYLDSTRTIVKLALDIKPLSFRKTNQVIDYNLNYLSYQLDVIMKQKTSVAIWNDDNVNDCSIDLARNLRKISWSSILSGRGLEGLETPDPIELLSGALITGDNLCYHCVTGDDKMTWLYLPGGISIDSNPDDNPPIRVPYIGSKTDERRIASLAQVPGASQNLKSVLRLAGVYIWAFGDNEQNWQDALVLAQTRTNITLDQLRVLTPLPTSSNLTHRLDDGVTQMKFTPASLYTFSNYVHISNDKQILQIDENNVDSNLIYQQIMITGLGIIETWNAPPTWQTHHEITLHLHTASACCVRPVDSCLMNTARMDIPSLEDTTINRFIYDDDPIPDSHISIIERFVVNLNIGDLEPGSTQENINLLSQLMGKVIVDSIMGLDESVSIINDAIVETDYSHNWISEFLNTYLDHVFISIGWNILLELSYQMYYLRIIGVTNIIDYVDLTLQRIPGLSIQNLAATISHPKILRRLINLGIVSPSNSPQFATLNFQKIAVQGLMWGIKNTISNIRNYVNLPILIHSEDALDLNDRIFNLAARKLTLISLLYDFPSLLPKLRGMTAEDKCKTLTDYLLSDINLGHINISYDPKFVTMVTDPLIKPYPCNSYYLSRKILNHIRSADDSDFFISNYYNDLGFIESNSFLDPLDENDKCNSILSYDIILNLLDHKDMLERYEMPFQESTSCDMENYYPEPPIHHILRPLGLSSTSWYKTLSLLNYLNIKRVPDGDHLYLAEGSGATMAILEAELPGRTVYYNSYYSSEMNPPQRNFEPMPTQFVESVPYKQIQAGIDCKDNFLQKYVCLWTGDTSTTDLSSKTCIQYIINKVGAETVSILHCDLEEGFNIPGEELTTAQVHILQIACHCVKKDGIFILKAHWLPFPKLSTIINICWTMASKIDLIRSSYSDPNSHEVYLVCTRAEDGWFSDLRSSIHMATSLTQSGYTLISPEKIGDYWDQLNNQRDHILEVIQSSLASSSISATVSDNMRILQAGGTLSAQDWYNIAVFEDKNTLLQHLANLYTVHLKEIVEIMKAEGDEYLSMIWTPYNLGAQGKINTTLRLLAEKVMLYIVKNWSVIEVKDRMTFVSNLELGEFNASDFFTVHTLYRLTNNPKYLKRTIQYSVLVELMTFKMLLKLSRPKQKQIWKLLGCTLFTNIAESDQISDQSLIDPSSLWNNLNEDDELTYDMFGNES